MPDTLGVRDHIRKRIEEIEAERYDRLDALSQWGLAPEQENKLRAEAAGFLMVDAELHAVVAMLKEAGYG